MPSPADLRQGLADGLGTIPGVHASAYALAGRTRPCLYPFPAEIEYDKAMGGGLDLWDFTVRAEVGDSSDRGAQERLDRLLALTGDESVKAALEADGTLGGVADDTHVMTCTGYREFELPGAASLILGAEWLVRVYAPRT